jgi:hypothetical protein
MADPLDWLSLEEAREAIGKKQASVDQSALIAMYVTATSRKLDSVVGAAVRRTVTDEVHSGCGSVIWLQHPAYAITSIKEYRGSTLVTLVPETAGGLESDAYLADRGFTATYNGRIVRRTGGIDWGFYNGSGNILVTYTAGRFEDTAAVDARFKLAASYMLANAWRSVQPNVATDGPFQVPTASFPAFAVPNVVRELLADEWRDTPAVA